MGDAPPRRVAVGLESGSSSDEEDDKPLIMKRPANTVAPPPVSATPAAATNPSAPVPAPKANPVPVAPPAAPAAPAAAAAAAALVNKPTPPPSAPPPKPVATPPSTSKKRPAPTDDDDESDSDDDSDDSSSTSDTSSDDSDSDSDTSSDELSSEDDGMTLGDIAKKRLAEAKAARRAALEAKHAAQKAKKRAKHDSGGSSSSRRKKEEKNDGVDRKKVRGLPEGEVMWTKLHHAGVLFPPEYEPHGVKMLYDGRPVELTAEEEEMATMFAAMRETEYMNKPTFLKNFWGDWQKVLGKAHVIQDLSKCDFTPIYEHLQAERERKKNMSKEEKLAIKEAKEAAEKDFQFCLVDDRKEKVGNFRVEPPGLFRGRGEHPRMGMYKRRVYPRDITLNLSADAPVPPCPLPGHSWKSVVHDPYVTWLAMWKDPVQPRCYKYIHLAAESSWKGQSDLEKYEKARNLKYHIEAIRAAYTRAFRSTDRKTQQIAVATYLIDKLALRAGHEKDEDEADTVGCCTLKCENIEPEADNHLKFDFLGKDSMKYENTVEVEEAVYLHMASWKSMNESGKLKSPGEQLFDAFDATDLNHYLKNFMPGLSAKVFRTYNASLTLNQLLREAETAGQCHEKDNVVAKKAVYDRANKDVAILCNHQKTVSKGFQASMDKVKDKIAKMEKELKDLQKALKCAKKGEPAPGAKSVTPVEVALKRVEKKREQIEKANTDAAVREDLKSVALGTSKINYMDPRISIAWCKRTETPIEKIFNKSLLKKFHWCMDVEPDFDF